MKCVSDHSESHSASFDDMKMLSQYNFGLGDLGVKTVIYHRFSAIGDLLCGLNRKIRVPLQQERAE